MHHLSILIVLLLFSGCVSARETATSVSGAQPLPVMEPVMPLEPEPSSSSKPTSVRLPIEWNNEDSWKWTDKTFPQPGDSDRLFRDVGDYASGTVLKSAAQAEEGITTVWFMLDTNQNQKADLWVKLTIDSKNDGEIRTKFSEVEE